MKKQEMIKQLSERQAQARYKEYSSRVEKEPELENDVGYNLGKEEALGFCISLIKELDDDNV
jgi:hypothetical protein